ncbi:MAG: DUF4199 domain-containing protein [Bacteroidetes bacterium]|nr:DUF4199 domain-containing protein [Bacteroidota bacterium]
MEPLDIIENKPLKSIAANALYYGLIIGFASIVYGVILWAFGLTMNKGLSWVGYIILIIGMYIGTNKYKKTYAGGYLSYGKSFQSSFMIVLFYSLLFFIWTFIFFKFLAGDLITQIFDQAQAKMLEQNPNMSEEEMQIGLKWVKMFTTPVMIALWGLLANLFFGTIIALIVGAIVKKDESTVV